MGAYKPNQEVFDQKIHTISIPESVRKSGIATQEIIAEAVAFLHRDGIIILDNAADVDHIEALNARMTPEALELAQDLDHHFNFGKHTHNMDQAPPPTKDLMFKDIWCNPFAAAILANLLGPKPVIHYANGNTVFNAPSHGRQRVHSDCEFAHPAFFPFAYVINFNLVDTSPANGATEFWPGSHHVSVHEAHDPASSEEIVEDDFDTQFIINTVHLEERRKHSPPIQATTKRGSMIIRDLRLWHAGMPNPTPVPRIMLAFVAQPAWYQARSKIQLPLSVKDMVESWGDEFQYCAEWNDGEVDYKNLSSLGVDFDTNSRVLKKYTKELSRWPDYVPRWY